MAEGKGNIPITCTRKQKSPSAISTPQPLKDVNVKISTLFFDLDNTLIPTRTGDLKACRKLAEVLENQFAFTKDESSTATQSFLKSFRRCPDNSQTSLDSWRTYLWRESLPNRFKYLAEQIYPKWLQLRYRYLALSLEFIQMLKRFREAGFLLALITNGPSNAQWEKIKKLHVSPYFDCVLVSSDLPWEKPNPNIFYAACNFLGVKPAECAMIGDKLETDIKGGHLASLGATFWMPLSNQVDIDLTDVTYPPDIVLNKLLDMCKYFPALNSGASSSSAMTSTNLVVHSASAGASTSAHSSRRRSMQTSCSITSTCDSDILYQRHHQTQQRHFQHHQLNNLDFNKYRRGGSLPAEALNSETENSSDSMIS